MRRLAAIAAVFIAGGSGAGEARVTEADLAQIRAAIHRQIGAFQSCAGRAASPGASSPLPASVSFLDVTVIGVEDVVQQVQVTDRAGTVWLAYYAMQRQSDGSWRTGGCRLVQPRRTISA